VAAWAVLLAVTPTAYAASPKQESQQSTRIWPVLLALAAASLAIERVIEVIWNYVDCVLLNFRGWTPLDLKSNQYTQFKSGTSLVLGIVLGVLLCNYTGMRLLEYLRPLEPAFLSMVPPVWDVLITGFVIGAGSKPTHDLLGILTETKNLLDGKAVKEHKNAGAAMADGVLKLAQSEAQAMIEVPGVGPARLATPGQTVHGAEGEDEENGESVTTTDRYIETLRKGTTT
jgi:hypothetical protein